MQGEPKLLRVCYVHGRFGATKAEWSPCAASSPPIDNDEHRATGCPSSRRHSLPCRWPRPTPSDRRSPMTTSDATPVGDERPVVMVTVTSDAGYRGEIRAGSHRFVVDEGTGVGGNDEGPNP